MPQPLNQPAATAPASARHVFVYGTLRRGQINDINRLQPLPHWVGPATVKGTLYHLGPYPGLRLDGSFAVAGEVYSIEPALELLLDEIEELLPQPSGEYLKRLVAVQVGSQWVDCLVYELAPERALGRAVIETGDWTNT